MYKVLTKVNKTSPSCLIYVSHKWGDPTTAMIILLMKYCVAIVAPSHTHYTYKLAYKYLH